MTSQLHRCLAGLVLDLFTVSVFAQHQSEIISILLNIVFTLGCCHNIHIIYIINILFLSSSSFSTSAKYRTLSSTISYSLMARLRIIHGSCLRYIIFLKKL